MDFIDKLMYTVSCENFYSNFSYCIGLVLVTYRYRTVHTQKKKLIFIIIFTVPKLVVLEPETPESMPLISVFQTRSRYFSIQVAPQLSSRG
jgi:hypothetical protein